MPKDYTFPFIFDEVQSLSITDLKRLGYLNYDYISGTITWNCRGEETGSIRVKVLMRDNLNFIAFDYKCNETEYKYDVQLVSLPSNLGHGDVWYFHCRFTNKRCRKLHLISERFMHRSALPSGMYSKQTESKKWRQMERIFGNYFDTDKLYLELYSKHFKKFYNGKPTKRYLKLINKINDAERFTASEIESLLMFGK